MNRISVPIRSKQQNNDSRGDAGEERERERERDMDKNDLRSIGGQSETTETRTLLKIQIRTDCNDFDSNSLEFERNMGSDLSIGQASMAEKNTPLHFGRIRQKLNKNFVENIDASQLQLFSFQFNRFSKWKRA